MDLASFGRRINSVQDIENFGQLQKDTVKQNRFTVKKNEMILESVEKPNLHRSMTKNTILKME